MEGMIPQMEWIKSIENKFPTEEGYVHIRKKTKMGTWFKYTIYVKLEGMDKRYWVAEDLEWLYEPGEMNEQQSPERK